ncbi:MAG: response regulator [Anaerolineae bacterium]|nr:response regulator [Anaerolineae bacterium]
MKETGAKVLIVDDERAIRRYLRTSLGVQGYQISEASTGEEAIFVAAQHIPDIIILDLGLPDMTGVEVTRRLREWTQTPILILSVQDKEEDKIAALDAGADDYVTKPFGIGELMARMRVAVRHSMPKPGESIFRTGQLEIDLSNRRVRVSGQEVQLTPTEYDLLRILVNHAGKVLTHGQLLKEVRGIGYQDETHLLRVHMSNLRRKLEPDPNRPQYILTEPGVGYRLSAED